jgi:hypothetical protein
MEIAAMVSCLHEPRRLKDGNRRHGSYLHEPRKLKDGNRRHGFVSSRTTKVRRHGSCLSPPWFVSSRTTKVERWKFRCGFYLHTTMVYVFRTAVVTVAWPPWFRVFTNHESSPPWFVSFAAMVRVFTNHKS